MIGMAFDYPSKSIWVFKHVVKTTGNKSEIMYFMIDIMHSQ